MERKTLDSCGTKRKGRDLTGEAEEIEKRKRLVQPRLDFLPEESKCL
jgi:hypothetical protein